MEIVTHNEKPKMPLEGYPLTEGRATAPVSQVDPFVDAQVVATPIVVSGVVDAILEVSRQRKFLLDQLRSALQSGNDAGALQLARQLCGLPG
jgi:hypothetical protein